ncbi:hypothetical protein GCM10009504_08360 [Pseudomonas laurentiana]|uniref:Uncharacterized protein n=1 Tax=Pseudomonas laurentiana TaxID=2364649 RepID=A0A6I5RQ65_9PSED|nr:hypothetical protein [Pseudomonas laurentiana]NES09736.1 hypothetical protein [Pseudomonas laurentiana]GGU53840.1 hypothetical protein GCM10009504_08360 [Pseudomonas laurentiana]
MMILLDPGSGLAVNPQDISTMRIDQVQSYEGVVLLLQIRMRTGEQLTISGHRDRPVSLLHKQLLEAK